MARKEGRKSTQKIWIYCEGKTEKLYFGKLKIDKRVSRVTIEPKISGYKDSRGIIKEAITFKNSNRGFQEGDIIACVFDRDLNSDTALEESVRLAKKESITISYSNPCFEYWFLCHYGYFPSPIEKAELTSKLKEHMGNYEKNDSEIYNVLKDMTPGALKNSKKIKAKHISEGTDIISRDSNPVTLIFELIELIHKFE